MGIVRSIDLALHNIETRYRKKETPSSRRAGSVATRFHFADPLPSAMSLPNTRIPNLVEKSENNDVEYPQGVHEDSLQELVADLDAEQFTVMELLTTDDKVLHALMCTKNNTAESHKTNGVTSFRTRKRTSRGWLSHVALVLRSS